MTLSKKYNIAKLASIGELFKCPTCDSNIVKKTYQHTFCSKKCKDKYWNTVDERKRNNITRISNAREKYMESNGFKNYKHEMEKQNLKDVLNTL